MGCSQGLARILMFITNFAFLLVGLALLVVGIMFKVNFNKYTDAIPAEAQALHHVPVFSIVVGAIIFFIAFLGCCGALRNNTCMLSWYGAILIVIFLAQVALGIYAFIQIKDKDQLKQEIVTAVGKIFGNYPTSSNVVNAIQSNFQCCGTTGPEYWSSTIPASCYPDSNTSSTFYDEGCSDTLAEYITSSIRTIAIVAIAVSAVEVVGAILALCLTSCIRESRRQGAYY